MNTYTNSSHSLDQVIENLKAKQANCTTILLECVGLREKYPDMNRRLDAVMSRVEAVMAETADTLAMLEANHSNDLKWRMVKPSR